MVFEQKNLKFLAKTPKDSSKNAFCASRGNYEQKNLPTIFILLDVEGRQTTKNMDTTRA
jgi:hypothetical protein